MKKTIVIIFALVISLNSFAEKEGTTKTAKSPEATPVETTSISGKVLDVISGETLTGVEISVEGTDLKTYTDFDGNYTFDNIVPGNYNIIASYISYSKSLIENIAIEKGNKEVEIKMQTSK